MQLVPAERVNAASAALSLLNRKRKVDLTATLDYFRRMYIRPAQNYLDIKESVLFDCASGVGFLAHAYILAGGKHAIAADMGEQVIGVAAEIGKALGIADRVEYMRCSITDLPIGNKSIDVFTSIETLEHVGKHRYAAVSEINRVTKRLVVLTTPNLWFPLIPHDTGLLPFAHWLPIPLRWAYATLFGRRRRHHNLFVSPRKLNAALSDFQRVSRVLTFDSFEEWVNVHPYYLHYGSASRGGKGTWISLDGGVLQRMKYYYLYLLSRLGPSSSYVAHNLSGIYAS